MCTADMLLEIKSGYPVSKLRELIDLQVLVALELLSATKERVCPAIAPLTLLRGDNC
jgi:hypothetical protein